VATSDCRVAVKGTVFSVSHGVGGSRVSVVAGEVQVSRDGGDRVLRAGEQMATSPRMARVAVAEDVRWSRDRDEYLAMLAELAKLQQKWQQVPEPGLRYISRLLPLLPDDTAMLVALPNYGETLAEGFALFEQQVEGSPALARWWRSGTTVDKTAELESLIGAVRELGSYVGDEVLIAASPRQGSPGPSVLAVAEVVRPGLAEAASAALTSLGATGSAARLRIVDETDLATLSAGQRQPLMLLDDDLVAIAFAPEPLRGLVARRASGGGRFTDGELGSRVLDAYRDGAGALAAVDVRRAARPNHAEPDGSSLRFVLAERKPSNGTAEHAARLSFDGSRSGPATWLAAPGPMGSLDFVSPGAAGWRPSSFRIRSGSSNGSGPLRRWARGRTTRALASCGVTWSPRWVARSPWPSTGLCCPSQRGGS